MDRRDLSLSGWVLVVAAAGTMGAAGIYQFAWSSIRLPLGARLGAPETALGTVFTLFVVFQTIGQFPVGWVRDRYGPRVPLLVAAVCLTAGFLGVGAARSLPAAALAYAVGGVGAGASYTVAVNTPLKWFEEHRGLATGAVTMSYGGLSFLVIPSIRNGVADAFQQTVVLLGVGTGLAALIAAIVLRDPAVEDGDDETVDESHGETDDETSDERTHSSDDERAMTWRETVRTWQFWLLYAVFAVVNGVGLMLIGKVVSYAAELSLPAAAGTAAASVVALADAGGVLIGGAASDRLGRRRTVAGSLVLSGAGIAAATVAGNAGFAWGFVAAVAAAAFFRSPTFAVFPSLVADYYGRAFSSENYGALYSAKLFGGVFGGTVTSALVITLGWSTSFLLAGGLLSATGVALVALRPVTDEQVAR